jgi:hypothetical protein
MQTLSRVLGVGVLVACGGSQDAKTPVAAAPASATNTSAKTDVANAAQMPVAHWKTGDGLAGLVFDRSGAIPKVKIDGGNDIIQLTPEERRRGSELEGTNYRNPQNHLVLFVSTYGAMEYYRGRDTLRLSVVDKAEALGAATVTGVAKAEKLENEVMADALKVNSLRVRFPAFTTNDASNPTKIAEALDKADKTMLCGSNGVCKIRRASLRRHGCRLRWCCLHQRSKV